jgi:hypothetical protein
MIPLLSAPRFPARVSGSQSRFAGTRTRRPATSVDRPAPATPWLAPSLRAPHGPNRLRRPKLYLSATAGRRRDPPLRRSEAGAPKAHAGRPRHKTAARSSITEQHQPWHSSANRSHGRMTFLRKDSSILPSRIVSSDTAIESQLAGGGNPIVTGSTK